MEKENKDLLTWQESTVVMILFILIYLIGNKLDPEVKKEIQNIDTHTWVRHHCL